jgi:hypothetical protein
VSLNNQKISSDFFPPFISLRGPYIICPLFSNPPQSPVLPQKMKPIFSGVALGYQLDDRGFESRQRLGIFFFTTVLRPALGPTQLPIQWVTGALSLGVKRPGHEANNSPPSTTEVKNAWSCTSTAPIRRHGMVLV